MAWLRSHGYTVELVEHQAKRRFTKTTRDFMGFADLIAIRLGDKDGACAIQATDGGHFAERKQKILDEPKATLWVKCGNRLWLMAWDLAGPAGKRKVYRHRLASFHDNGDNMLVMIEDYSGALVVAAL